MLYSRICLPLSSSTLLVLTFHVSIATVCYSSLLYPCDEKGEVAVVEEKEDGDNE